MFRYIKKGNELIAHIYTREITSIFKDRGALLILFFAIIIYPIIYGIAYKNEVLRDLSVAVVDLDKTPSSRQLSNMLDATEQLDVINNIQTLEEAELMFHHSKINGIIIIPQNFEKSVIKGEQTSLSVYCDAGYLLKYKQTLSGTLKASATFGAGVEIKKHLAKGLNMEQAYTAREPIGLNAHLLYNSAGGYNTFILPGFLIVLLQQTLLIGIGLMGGTQREYGTQRFSIPLPIKKGSVIPFVVGRAGAYFTIYILNVIFTQVWVYKIFNIPLRATFMPLSAIMIPFLLATTFLGLGITTLFKRREHSILFMVFLSPIILFISGLSWPVSAIPTWLQTVSKIFPSTYAVPAIIRVQLMGAEMQHITVETKSLLIQGAIYFIFALLLYYRASAKNNNRIKVNQS